MRALPCTLASTQTVQSSPGSQHRGFQGNCQHLRKGTWPWAELSSFLAQCLSERPACGPPADRSVGGLDHRSVCKSVTSYRSVVFWVVFFFSFPFDTEMRH